MDEHKKKKENKSFKYGLYILLVVIIFMGLGFCSPFVITKQGKMERYNNKSEVQIYKTKYEKQTSNFKTNIPSIKYQLQTKETLRQLANRLHCSVYEIKKYNPGLKNTPPATDIPKGEVIEVPGKESLEGYEKEVLNLTNKERAKFGLKPLQSDYANLNKSAHAKSVDMNKNQYFSHNSPVYGSPFEMMKTFGVTYKTAGENIAQGQRTPAEVVKAWMDSPGHRQNIMNAQFTHMGVGYYKGKSQYWTQQFVGK